MTNHRVDIETQLSILLHDKSHQAELDGVGGGEVLLLHMGSSSIQKHLLTKRLHNQWPRVVGPIKLYKMAINCSQTDEVVAHPVTCNNGQRSIQEC